jgi:hypothetical protein
VLSLEHIDLDLDKPNLESETVDGSKDVPGFEKCSVNKPNLESETTDGR